MYESPINLVVQDIEKQMVQKEEQTILEAIRKCDVVVDKNELIKAINYDRNQYSKGYKDGVNDVLDKIIAEIEREADSGQWSKPAIYGMKKSIAIIAKYKSESEIKDEES